MRAILCHGWASFSGRTDIDRLGPYLINAGLEVVQFDYGWQLIVTPMTEKLATRLAAESQRADCIIAHSNGSLIAQRASLLNGKARHLILLNPALGDDVTFGPYVERVDVFYTPSDGAVRFGSWLPFGHPWGEAGVKGITTGDPRVHNHNMAEDYPVKVIGHLDIFQEKKLSFYGPMLSYIAITALAYKENHD